MESIATNQLECRWHVLGRMEEDKRSQTVAVFDVEKNTIQTSSLILPAAPDGFGLYDAAIVRERSTESLLAFGYIRDFFESSSSGRMPLMSRHMMEMISQWVSVGFIHVVRIRTYSREHFKVNVDKIMRSLE